MAVYGDDLAYAIAVGLIFAVSMGVGQAPGEAIADAAFSVVALALPFAAGITVRTLGRRTATLETEQTAAAAKAAEEERRRIARELHDIISHGLGLVVLQAGVADQVLDRDPDQAREALAQIRQTGQEAIGELSTLVGLIREDPATLADPQPPSPTLSGWSKAHGRPDLMYSFAPKDRHDHYTQRSTSTPIELYKRD